MLDVQLRAVKFREIDLTLNFGGGTHTAVIGPPASGVSTLLKLIAGELRPERGEIIFGTRVVNDLKPSRRPLVLATHALDIPARWSIQHALIAAVRSRTLDREDRHREYELAVAKWKLDALIDRRLATLSITEQTRVHLARIELLRPAILVADRLLAFATNDLADEIYRTLRVIGTTVISAPATHAELGFTDRVVVIDRGRVIQQGSAAEIYSSPVDEAAAIATGDVNALPISIHGSVVDSVIGSWDVERPTFEGSGIALIRPDEFTIATPGEDSDLIFGIEEASFRDGRWHCRGVLSGNVMLHVVLPRDAAVHKGKLVPLRYDARNFRLVQRAIALPGGIPTDVVPPLRETR